LVEQNFSCGDLHIRRDHATEGKLHHVTRHELSCGYDLPRAVASDRCVQCEPRLQRGQGCLSAPLLKKPESGVEHQETGDDRRLGIVTERDLEHNRSLEHPGDGGPELAQRPAQRLRGRVRRCVWTKLLQSASGLVARQAVLRAD